MRKKTINPIIHQPVRGFARFRLSAAERAMGRVMRAPDDHGAGEGGDAGAGDGSGGDAGGEGGAGAAPADGGADGQGQGAPAGGADDGGKDGAGDNAGGAGGADGDGSILSDAVRDGADGKPGGEGKDGGADGEGQRLTFGEGDAAAEILGAPDAYELVVPEALAAEGMAFDAEAFALVEPVMRDLNLSNAAAQQIVNVYAEKIGPLLASRGQNAAETMGADMRRQWATDAEAEFNGKDGNPTMQEAKGLARQAFVASGIKADSPFLTMLEESGLGNHPDMIRFVSWVGRNVGEAKVDAGTSAPAPLSLADRVYGKPDPA